VNLEAFCHKLAKSYGKDRVQITIPPVSLRLDRHLLQRSLNNLIDNALEYGSPPVVVSLENGADSIAINVDDHGSAAVEGEGIPLPSSLPIPAIHRGLGLAIAESFCRQHGGRLVVGRSRLGGLQVGLHLGKQTLAGQRLLRPRS